MTEAANLATLSNLIKEVKPALADHTIRSDDYLIDTLGLDSLDLVQLARAVRKNMNRGFDQDQWLDGAQHHRYSVASLLEAASQG